VKKHASRMLSAKNGQMELAARAAECFGCGAPATDHYRDAPMCGSCAIECRLLSEMYAAPSPEEATEQAPAVKTFSERMQLGRWFWLVNLLVVAGGLLYLYFSLGKALLEWIQAGGVQ